jgi:hypothetical protein
MNCVELIGQLIHRDALVPVEPYNSRLKVVLREPESGSQAQIYNLPPDAIVFRLDERFEVERIFKGNSGECKRGDFILIATLHGTLFVIHLEMKRTKGSKPEIKQQLLGSWCFTHYMQEIGRRFWGHNLFLETAEHRYISLRGTDGKKRRTKLDSDTALHDSPDQPLTISSPNYIEFGRLCGRKWNNA